MGLGSFHPCPGSLFFFFFFSPCLNRASQLKEQILLKIDSSGLQLVEVCFLTVSFFARRISPIWPLQGLMVILK